MSHTLQDKRPSVADGPNGSLSGARMPRWAPLAIAVGSAALGCLIGVGAGLDSKIQWALLAALIFVVATYLITAKVEGSRQGKNQVATSLVWVAFLLAVIPLLSLAWTTISKGAGVVDGYFLSHSMSGLLDTDEGGGVYHALLGTIEQVAIAAVIATPIGLLTAVYLVEYGTGKLSRAVTFFVDVMTGIPSIVAGLFILSTWNLMLGFGVSGFAGALALSILMMPVVVRSTEEMLKLVPNELREASLALGVPQWRTILKVVLPTAIGGITTGVMLAIARITGETAPVLLLVFGTKLINPNPFEGAQSSLPLYVFEQYSVGTDASHARAWGAALVLIAFVMILNLVARGIARWKAPKTGR